MERRTTTLGTPCSPRWSANWIARVNDIEAQLGRRICGGVGYDDAPCTIASDHPSGRCRYHGGNQGVGGQFYNANARVHGLYARRIQRCGRQCVLWNSCPMAGDDVLELPEAKRPSCVYEREEYLELLRFYFNAEPDHLSDGDIDGDFDFSVLREYMGEAPSPDAADSAAISEEPPNPSLLNEDIHLAFPKLGGAPDPFLLHQMIVLQILVSRAAAAVADTSLTDVVEVESKDYKMKTAKPGAKLEAFIRLSREYRGLRNVIVAKKLIPPPAQMDIGSQMRPFYEKYGDAIETAIREVQSKNDAQRRKEERMFILKRQQELGLDLPNDLENADDNGGEGATE